MEDLYNIYNKYEDNYDFIHFESSENCDNYIKTNNIIFIQKCCGGKGYKYLKNNNNSLKKDLMKEAECVICYEFKKTKKTKCCKQTLCLECNNTWKQYNNNCPYCRNESVYK